MVLQTAMSDTSTRGKGARPRLSHLAIARGEAWLAELGKLCRGKRDAPRSTAGLLSGGVALVKQQDALPRGHE
jgi:hypothetical protein